MKFSVSQFKDRLQSKGYESARGNVWVRRVNGEAVSKWNIYTNDAPRAESFTKRRGEWYFVSCVSLVKE